MDQSSHLPPPDFYLSHPGMGLVMEFVDVQVFETRYTSTPNVQPLLGMNAPFVSEGSGGGMSWEVQASINPMHMFWNGEDEEDGGLAEGGSARRKGTPYGDLLLFKRIIEEYGPSPLFVLHRPGMEAITVALVGLTDTVFLQESVRDFDSQGNLPALIPVSFSLIERRSYKVTVF